MTRNRALQKRIRLRKNTAISRPRLAFSDRAALRRESAE
jgi:hypothetical protein